MVTNAKKPASNPFANAPTLATVTPISKAKGKRDRDEFEIEGLKKVAAMAIVADAIKNESELRAKEVKSHVVEHYVDLMMETGKKPESFLGVEDNASASCEIRKRGSNLAISPETAEKLVSNGISVAKNVKVQERYCINPALSVEEMQLIADVLAKNPKTAKIQAVMIQPEESIYVTTDTTIDELAQTKNRDLITEVVEAVAVFAVGKFKLDAVDPKAEAIEILKKLGIL